MADQHAHLIAATDEPHELVHHIAVVVGRPEGVLGDRPAGREHNKVCHSNTYSDAAKSDSSGRLARGVGVGIPSLCTNKCTQVPSGTV